MSHTLQGEACIKDLDALADAAKALGGELVKDKKTFAWYGSFIDDSPIPDDMFSPAETHRLRVGSREERQAAMNANFNKCAHVIKFKGASYEVGVVKKEDGSMRLRWDWYGPGGLIQKLGDRNAGLLLQRYNLNVARKAALKRGYRPVEVKKPDGSIDLVLVK